ncbi:MAG: flavin reductase [Oscillospiraceae bacterium]|nr:flavin reductase [Oscillospiraceae bacterium]
MKGFDTMKEISVNGLDFNPWDKIGKEWFLLTGGDEKGFNTMTASWGFSGVMWGKNTFITVVRPIRYTYDFMEKNELFTASFFDEKYRPALSFCGSHSGRDCDKMKETGLTPEFIDGTTAFKEAKLVLVCRKIYAQDMDASLLAEDIKPVNGSDPIHKQYIGEIIKAYAE